jgi:hypothetical protein
MQLQMKCPSCGTDYTCPCNSCNPDTPNTKFSFEPDGIKCLSCGIVRDEGWWMDEEYRQLCDQYGVGTLTEVIRIQEAQIKKDDTK